MFILKILRWILSYITIEIEGGFAERFLNLAPEEGVSVWNVRRTDETHIKLCIRASDFKRVRRLAKRSSCSVRIKDKTGLKFVMFRHRKRKAFVICAIICFAAIIFMSNFLWGVELSGADFIDNEELLESLSDAGLRVGVPLSSLDLDDIQNKVIVRHDSIAWITIHLKGTRAYVDVRPRTIAPHVTDKSEICNIVSSMDAVVEYMEVYEGEAVVINGEAVTGGQLLVSGVVDSETEGVRFLRADAKIEGRVWIPVSISIPINDSEKIYTGESMRKHALEIGDHRINLFLNSSIPYSKYDKIIERKTLKIGDFALPFTHLSADISEYKENEYPLYEDAAKEKLEGMCDDELSRLYPDARVQRKDIKFTKTNDSYIMDAEYECVIPIAKKVSIMREQMTEE